MSIVELEAPQTTSTPLGDAYSDFSREDYAGEANFDREKVVAFIGQDVEFKGPSPTKGAFASMDAFMGRFTQRGPCLLENRPS